MPRLSAAMAKQQPVTAPRIDAHCHQRGHGADKTVDQHRDACLGTAQIGTDQGGDFKTAEAEQRPQWIIR
ncbi:hypothetical protein D3C77_452180 [compost metagenome]